MCHCESPQECLIFSSSQTSLSLGSLCAVRVLWEALTCAVSLHSSRSVPPSHSFPVQPHQCYQSDSWLLLVSLRHLELLVVTSHLSVSLVFSALDHVLASTLLSEGLSPVPPVSYPYSLPPPVRS